MPVIRNWLLLSLSIAAALGADKDKAPFKPRPVTDYPARQTIEKVTIAAQPFDSDELARQAFGKLNPYKHGILPILVVMQNGSDHAVSLEQIKIEYVLGNRSRVEATPASEVRYAAGPRKPDLVASPLPTGAPRIGRKKNPLEAWEIEGRAFAAKMLPPGQSTSGFFYFQTGHSRFSKLYITGLRDARSGKELFYFEIPLEAAAR